VLRVEPGISLPALMFSPPEPRGAAHLYLHGEGKQADAMPGGPIEKLVRAGHLVLAVDLRGLGEMRREKSIAAPFDALVGADWPGSLAAKKITITEPLDAAGNLIKAGP